MKRVLTVLLVAAVFVFAALVLGDVIRRSEPERQFNIYVAGAQPFTIQAKTVRQAGNCWIYATDLEWRICVPHVAAEVKPGTPPVQPQVAKPTPVPAAK
mgnify:CR=1 FL=1